MEERGGEEGQGPSYKVLNSCFACPMSFPESLKGENLRKGQERADKEERSPLKAQDFIVCGQRPTASENERCKEGGREWVKVAGSSDEDQRQQGEWQH